MSYHIHTPVKRGARACVVPATHEAASVVNRCKPFLKDDGTTLVRLESTIENDPQSTANQARYENLKKKLGKNLLEFVLLPVCEEVVEKPRDINFVDTCKLFYNSEYTLVSVLPNGGNKTLHEYCVRMFRESSKFELNEERVSCTRATLAIMALYAAVLILDNLCKKLCFHNDAHLSNFVIQMSREKRMKVCLVDNNAMTTGYPDTSEQAVSPNDTPQNLHNKCHFDAFGFSSSLNTLIQEVEPHATGAAKNVFTSLQSKLALVPISSNIRDLFGHMASNAKAVISTAKLLDALQDAYRVVNPEGEFDKVILKMFHLPENDDTLGSTTRKLFQ
jgi:hypothetical protein